MVSLFDCCILSIILNVFIFYLLKNYMRCKMSIFLKHLGNDRMKVREKEKKGTE